MQSRLKTISTSELNDAYGNIFKIETKELPVCGVAGRRMRNVTHSFAACSSEILIKERVKDNLSLWAASLSAVRQVFPAGFPACRQTGFLKQLRSATMRLF